ncbi:HlyD family efflux transporter periplasmic adaptor subunit [Paenibacillus rhizoplanae]
MKSWIRQKKAIDKANSDIVDGQESIAAIHEDMAPPDPLTAPIDGTITAVNITDGEQAQNGAELFTMTDYVNLSVTVQVDELDIPPKSSWIKPLRSHWMRLRTRRLPARS